MTDNTLYAYQKLQGIGYTPVQAAGIVGLVQESGVNPGDGPNGADSGRSASFELQRRPVATCSDL